MGADFTPFRLDVAWPPSAIAPIRPLLEHLDLTRGLRNWGYVFRFGLVQISATDFVIILAAMTKDAHA